MIAIAKDIMLVVVMMIAIDSGDDDQNTTNPSSIMITLSITNSVKYN